MEHNTKFKYRSTRTECPRMIKGVPGNAQIKLTTGLQCRLTGVSHAHRGNVLFNNVAVTTNFG